MTVNADDKAVYNRNNCFGCGLCVTTCPTDSLILERKPDDQLTLPQDEKFFDNQGNGWRWKEPKSKKPDGQRQRHSKTERLVMHELSLTKSILNTALRYAQKTDSRKIVTIALDWASFAISRKSGFNAISIISAEEP